MAFEATYVQAGDTIDYTPGSDVAAGEVVVVATDLVGIARHAIAASAMGALTVKGVFRCAKEAPLVIALGDAVYWDAVNDNVDKTDTNSFMGTCVEAAASADTTVLVRLDFGSVAA